MNPRLFEGPEENDFPEDQAVSTGGKDPGSVENPKRVLYSDLCPCAPTTDQSFSGAGRAGFMVLKEPEGDPDAPGSYQ